MQPVSPDQVVTSQGSRAAVIVTVAAAVFAALLLACAIGLWAYYGTTVFFEMVKSGIAACM